MDGASPAAFKELKRALKFVVDTKNLALRFKPKLEDDKKWRIIAYSDSDWANDKETRISVTGFILYLLGVPISWKSKSQQGVTMSSSEAEFVALSEAAKEINDFTWSRISSEPVGIECALCLITIGFRDWRNFEPACSRI